MEKPKITIIGKRWLDKQNGNTYHSAEVHVDGKYLWKVPYRYGDNETYLHTGFEILQEHHLYPADSDYFDFAKDFRSEPVRFSFVVSEVERRDKL